MRFLTVLACLLLLVPALTAADVSGKWSGSLDVKMPDGGNETYSVRLEVVQKGEDVTGSIGRESDEKLSIEKGKMEGNKLTFEVTPPESGYPVKFELVLEGAKLEGTLKGDTDGGPVTGTVSLSKAE